MQIPPVGMIEAAGDALNKLDPVTIEKEVKELHGLGMAQRMRILPEHSLTQFQIGYLLGVQTARVMLMTMPKAVEAGVEI